MHLRRWSQDGGGIGRGDHFLPHTFIKSSFECWATSAKQLLNAGRGHQTPRNEAHSLQKEVGPNIKDETAEKKTRDGDPSWEGATKEEKFPHSRKCSHRWVCGEFWNRRGQHSWEKNKQTNKQINKQNPPQNLCLTVTASGEVAQTLASATSGQGQGREVRIASSVLRVRTGLTALRIIWGS